MDPSPSPPPPLPPPAPQPLDFLSTRAARRKPLAGSFYAPTDISGPALLSTAAAIAADIAAVPPPPFHRRSAKSLRLTASAVAAVLGSLASALALLRWPPSKPYRSADLALRELFVALHRAKLLAAEVAAARRAWLLLRIVPLADAFRDADAELAVALDVFAPAAAAIGIPPDAAETLDLLRRRCSSSRRSDWYLSPADIAVREELTSFLDCFGNGEIPEMENVRSFVVSRLGISDSGELRDEIDYLEEQIALQDDAAALPLIGGVVAFLRYCRFTIFDPAESTTVPLKRIVKQPSSLLMPNTDESSSTSFLFPKEFICPISLELMRDPVVASTGQTYDRPSIVQWIEQGHRTCPNSGQQLADDRLVPNCALRSLIAECCAAYGIPYDVQETGEKLADNVAAASGGKAAGEANRATAGILVRLLKDGPDSVKAVAAHELRMLAKIAVANRAYIAGLGAVPLLCRLLSSEDRAAQQNAVTALLNLSIYEGNKELIVQEDGCLELIIGVLRNGLATEARENAAATLFSLSVVHEYKKMIADATGAVEELAKMLQTATARGKKDAAMALFNLSTHPDNWNRLLVSGAVSALVNALGNDAIAEECAGALALLMKHSTVTHSVVRSETVVSNLMALLRRGTQKGQENAVAALYEMCRRGGSGIIHRISRTPGLLGLVQNILATGTKRAKKKASVVLKSCQRQDFAAVTAAVDNSISMIQPPIVMASASGSGMRRAASFGHHDLPAAAPSSVSISVPVP